MRLEKNQTVVNGNNLKLLNTPAVDRLEENARKAVELVAKFRQLQTEIQPFAGLLGLNMGPLVIDRPVKVDFKETTKKGDRVPRSQSLSARVLAYMAHEPITSRSAQEVTKAVGSDNLASTRAILDHFVKIGLLVRMKRNVFIAAQNKGIEIQLG